jgi:glyoxylase I family protein
MREPIKSPIDACHHVAIVVRDADAARAFYGELLGLEELERPADVGARFAGAWYRLGAVELHVFEQKDYAPPRAPIGPHIALHTADFEQAIERLSARGCSFVVGPGRGEDGVARAILRDPTGNVVELTDAALRA